MRATWVIPAALAVIVVAGAAGPPAGKRDGILAPLRAGQRVSLKEVAGGYQVTVMPDVNPAYKVLEVGPDFLVVEDINGVTELRIPVYSVRAVRVIRLPR